jgi:hypothetical protein
LCTEQDSKTVHLDALGYLKDKTSLRNRVVANWSRKDVLAISNAWALGLLKPEAVPAGE